MFYGGMGQQDQGDQDEIVPHEVRNGYEPKFQCEYRDRHGHGQQLRKAMFEKRLRGRLPASQSKREHNSKNPQRQGKIHQKSAPFFQLVKRTLQQRIRGTGVKENSGVGRFGSSGNRERVTRVLGAADEDDLFGQFQMMLRFEVRKVRLQVDLRRGGAQ